MGEDCVPIGSIGNRTLNIVTWVSLASKGNSESYTLYSYCSCTCSEECENIRLSIRNRIATRRIMRFSFRTPGIRIFVEFDTGPPARDCEIIVYRKLASSKSSSIIEQLHCEKKFKKTIAENRRACSDCVGVKCRELTPFASATSEDDGSLVLFASSFSTMYFCNTWKGKYSLERTLSRICHQVVI